MEEGSVKVGELGEAMEGGVVVVDWELAPLLRGMASFFDIGLTAVTGGAVMKVAVGVLVSLESRLIIPQAVCNNFEFD